MILHSDRLHLEPIKISDAAFFCELLNDKDWIANIRDSQLRTVAAVESYIRETVIPNFHYKGLGFYVVRIKETMEAIGMSTLIKRDTLETIDIGYGFLPKGRGKGYAIDATQCMMHLVSETLKYPKVLAITKPHNLASQKLLLKLGFESKGLKKVFDTEDLLFEYVFN